MHCDMAGAVLGRDLHPKSEQVAQLPFQSLDVGISLTPRPPTRCGAVSVSVSGPGLAPLGEFFGVSNRQTSLDNLTREHFRILRTRDRPRMSHAEFARSHHIPD